jgi:amphi-Trp domain-containing protein
MSKKFKKKVTLSREHAAERLIAIGEALSLSGDTTVELDGESVATSVPDELTFELEVKDNELELELKWARTNTAPGGADETSNESAASSEPHESPLTPTD